MNATEIQRWSPIYLSVEMLHRGGTEEDEETDPERGSLKGDRFVGFISTFFRVIGLEEHCVEEEREKTENEKQLDKENGQIFCMMLDPATGLRGDDLINIVEVDATGKQQDEEQDTRDFLVMLIERIGNRLDLFLGNRLLQPRSHGHDEERESADPDDRREQVDPMIDDRDQRIEVGNEALKIVHSDNRQA
jgi:hypothetical protein